MPKSKKKNYFLNGKYGTKSAITQANFIFNELCGFYTGFVPNTDKVIRSYIDDNNANLKGRALDEGIGNYRFDGDSTVEYAKLNDKRIRELRNQYHQAVNKYPKLGYYSGYLALVDKAMDLEAGDFGRAMVENSYLSGLFHQHHNGPLIGGRINPDDSIKYLNEVNPVTHKKEKGPLFCLNEFFRITADLLQREYEKHEIIDNYTPEKEAQYLEKLNNDFKAMLANHKVIESFIKEDGTSDFDKFLNGRLDTFARKDIKSHISRRTAKAQIENIRGQQKAIENGWGMNELDFPGKVSELSWYLQTQIKELKSDIAPEIIERDKNTTKRRIEDAREYLTKTETTFKKIETEYLKIKNNKSTNKDVLTKKKNEFESANKKYNKAKADLELEITREKNYDKEYENKRKQLRDVTRLSNEIELFNTKIRNTKIKNASDKIKFTEDFAKIIGKKRNYPFDVNDEIEKVSKYCDHSMRFAGRRNGFQPEEISQDVRESTLTDEEIEIIGPHYYQNGIFSAWLSTVEPIDKIYPHLVLSLHGEYDNKRSEKFENKDNYGQLRNHKFAGKRSGVSVEIKEDIDVEDGKEAIDFSNKIKVLTDEALHNMKGYQKDMKRGCKTLSTINEVENGNVMKAMIDHNYLLNFFTQTTGNAIDAFGLKHSPKDTSRHLKEVGVLDAYNDFMDAGNDFFLLEYDKQRMQKSGWNEEKEKLYLAKLDECMAKSIDSFEKLVALPLDVQEEEKYMGNSVGHVTGNDASETTRDIMPELMGLKWMREGIRLGYSSRDLEVLSVAGKLEGSIRRAKLKVQNYNAKAKKKLEEYKEKYRNEYYKLDNEEKKELIDEINYLEESIIQRNKLYDVLVEFENEKFKPLKESILNRKIKTPSDVIKTVIQLQDFYNSYKGINTFDSDLLKASGESPKIYYNYVNIFSDNIPAYQDKYFKDVINNNLKDLQNMKPGETLPELNRKFNICDKSREIEAFNNIIINCNINDKSLVKNAMANLFINTFLNGMNQDAHPEFFDPKHPDYIISNERLLRYTEQYSDRILEIMQPKTAKELFYLIDNGNHKEFFADVKERISADAAKSRYNSFLTGKPARFKSYKSIGEAHNGLVKASEKGRSSGLYKDIVSDLEKLEKMKQEISRDMLNQEREGHSIKIIGYEKDYLGREEKNKPLYEMKNGKEIKIDPKKLKAYKELQKSAADKIDKYLAAKDKKIREKGGDPTKLAGQALLGETGDRHYKAMLDAKASISALNKATTEYEQHGITYAERVLSRYHGFNVVEAEYLKDSTVISPEESKKAYDAFIAVEKERYITNLKYNLIDKYKQLKDELANDNLKQFAKRAKLMISFSKKKNPTEEEQKTYEDAIFESAVQTLYSHTIQNSFGHKIEDQMIKINKENQKNADKAFKAAEDKYNEDYQKLLDYYEPTGDNPPEAEKKKLKDAFDIKKDEYEKASKNNNKYNEFITDGKYPAELIDKISVKTLTTINEGLTNGKNDYLLKNPNQIQVFKTQIINNKPFKTEFRKRVIEAAKSKKLSDGDILKIRDNIIKKSAIKNEKKPEELKRLDGISKLLGSNISSKNVIKQANKAKQIDEKQKAVGKGLK